MVNTQVRFIANEVARGGRHTYSKSFDLESYVFPLSKTRLVDCFDKGEQVVGLVIRERKLHLYSPEELAETVGKVHWYAISRLNGQIQATPIPGLGFLAQSALKGDVGAAIDLSKRLGRKLADRYLSRFLDEGRGIPEFYYARAKVRGTDESLIEAAQRGSADACNDLVVGFLRAGKKEIALSRLSLIEGKGLLDFTRAQLLRTSGFTKEAMRLYRNCLWFPPAVQNLVYLLSEQEDSADLLSVASLLPTRMYLRVLIEESRLLDARDAAQARGDNEAYEELTKMIASPDNDSSFFDELVLDERFFTVDEARLYSYSGG